MMLHTEASGALNTLDRPGYMEGAKERSMHTYMLALFAWATPTTANVSWLNVSPVSALSSN